MWRTGLLITLVAAALAGCGSSGDSGSTTGAGTAPAASAPGTADLDGRAFVAIAMEGREAVPGAPVAVSFRDGQIAAETGCNGLGGEWRVEDGRLRTGGLMGTMMACEDPLMEQERWMRDWLEAGPQVALSGDRLTLIGDDGVTIVLREQKLTTGPRKIAGTTWRLVAVGTTDGSHYGLTSKPSATPTLRIGEDGTVELFGGCNRGGGKAVVRDDGFVEFRHLTMTELACTPQKLMRREQKIRAVLSGRTAAAFTGEHELVLTRGGVTLQFQAAG